MKHFFLSLLCLVAFSAIAQDTVVVQTLSYDDITKRRDFYAFPDGSESYRKVIMEYSLKCDSRTTQDGYACGEWDYLTYTYLYDKSGKWDSTAQSGPNFRVNGATRDDFEYLTVPQHNVYRHKQYIVHRDSTISLTQGSIGNGTQSLNITNGTKASRIQSIWMSSELTGAGLSAGAITGLTWTQNTAAGTAVQMTVRMAHTSLNSASGDFETNLQEVYRGAVPNSVNQDLQFVNEFNWNGSDNLIVEFLFDFPSNADYTNANLEMASDQTASAMSVHAASTDYYLDFERNAQQVNLGRIPELDGAAAKTIEAWVYTRQFNNAGVWQAGRRGMTSGDFSLRTRTATDAWRVQHWGTPDYDFTSATSNAWHHFALTYDGNQSKVYVDGQLTAQKFASLNTGTLDMIVGRWQGNYFNGKIDEMRVWKAALAQNTIQDWMNKSVDSQHPNNADLIKYLPVNEGSGATTADAKSSDTYTLQNYPWWSSLNSSEIHLDASSLNMRPSLTFEQGVYVSRLDSMYINDTVVRRPMKLDLYTNPASGVQIDPNDPNHPSLVTSTLEVWEANSWSYVYDAETGSKVDSFNIGAGTSITRSNKSWYTPDSRFEIGRFITPYGINLTHPQINSAEGYTWYYDVSDYEPLFRDTMEFSAGNQQELIDVKFLFIKGTPPRDVKGVKRIWGQNRSYSYRNLDDDLNLSEVSLDLDPSAESFKVKTRFTGHGHNSSTGGFPHCCEWKDNEHYLYVDGAMVDAWHVWQSEECAQNPLYPQGGTWPGAREGWCPGDVVKDSEFEIGQHVAGNTVRLDYDITSVPTNNPGMGGGNYQVAMHMISYGAQNFQHDAELLDIISPNNKAYYDRRSLVCGQPKVLIRNNGSTEMTSLNIYYGVKGGQEILYEWTGNLAPNTSEEVELVVEGNWFWSGDFSNMFYARLGEPNGQTDEYAANDRLEVEVEIPEHYSGKVVFQITSNNQPQDNEFYVKSLTGNTLIWRSTFTANTTYRDTLELEQGCYFFELLDEAHDGLSYWANNAQGNGSIRMFILDQDNRIVGVKSFEPEFGNQLRYNFTIDRTLGYYPNTGLSENSLKTDLSLIPNPTNGQIRVELVGLEGETRLEVINNAGQIVLSKGIQAELYHEEHLDISELPSGMYVVKLQGSSGQIQKRLIKH